MLIPRILALLAFVYAPGAFCLSLNAALTSAYHNNPKFKMLRLDMKNCSTKLLASGLFILPDGSIASGSGVAAVDKTVASLTWELSLASLGKPLEAKAKEQADVYKLLEQERHLLQEGVCMYLDCYQAQQTLRATKAKLELAKKQEAFARTKLSMGDSTAGQVAIAEANTLNTRLEYEKSKSNLAFKEMEFRNFFVIPDQVPALALTEDELKAPQSLDSFTELVLGTDYGVASRNKEVEVAKRRCAAVNLKLLLPSVKFKVSNVLAWHGPRPKDANENSKEVLLSWTPFSSPPTSTPPLTERIIKKREARKAHLEVQSYKNELSIRALKLWNSYTLASLECTSSKKALDANQLSFLRVQREHSLGKSSLIDLCRAEQELENARLAHVKANVECKKALYELLSMSGLYRPLAHIKGETK